MFLKHGVVQEIVASPPLSSSWGIRGVSLRQERARKHSLFFLWAARLIDPPFSVIRTGATPPWTSGVAIEVEEAEEWLENVSILMIDQARDTFGICSK